MVYFSDLEKQMPTGVYADRMPGGPYPGPTFDRQSLPGVTAMLAQEGASAEYAAFKAALCAAGGPFGWDSDRAAAIAAEHRAVLSAKGVDIFFCMYAAGIGQVLFWYWIELKVLSQADPSYTPAEWCGGYDPSTTRPIPAQAAAAAQPGSASARENWRKTAIKMQAHWKLTHGARYRAAGGKDAEWQPASAVLVEVEVVDPASA